MAQLPGPRLGVEPLHVPRLRDLQRDVDEDLEELARLHPLARHPSFLAEGRDEGDQHDQARVRHQPRHLGHPSDVLDAVGVREAEVPVQPVTHVVAVQHHRVEALGEQALLDAVGDGGLARAGQAGEPEHQRRLAFERCAVGPADGQGLRMNVCRPTQGETDHAGTGGLVRHPVDQDEAAEVAVQRIGLEGDGGVERQGAQADVVQGQGRGGQHLAGIDIDLVLEIADPRPDRLGTQLEPVGPAGQQGAFGHPDQVGLELVRDLRGSPGGGDQIAARDIHVWREGQGHGLARVGLVEVAVQGDDALDPGADA